MTRRKQQNLLKTTVHGNCHSSAPIKNYTGYQGPIGKTIGIAIFLYKMHLLIECTAEVLDEVEVHTLVLSRFLSAG